MSAAVPDTLTEQPPADRYCDLVLNGGVASGVVYPWAVLELARHYRFRGIGGNSVGAVAAALAAASEYGRCMNAPHPFEALRRVPGDLAEIQADGRTKMLSLFQPNVRGQRLFRIVVEVMTLVSTAREPSAKDKAAAAKQPGAAHDRALRVGGVSLGVAARWLNVGGQFLCAYALPSLRRPNRWTALGLVAAAIGATLAAADAALWAGLVLLVLAGALLLVGFAFGLGFVVAQDIDEGVLKNDLGFCRGLTQPGALAPGFVDWMHEGIQKAAGLRVSDAPLTFADLWHAPRLPGEPPRSRRSSVAPRDERSIDLQLVTTNVTHGRGYLLPLQDASSQLYFDPDEWENFFPPSVMAWLKKVSRPYAPLSPSDPPESNRPGLLEIPAGDLPVVVAARMSMSFPLLFSSVPVHAVDYETPRQIDARPARKLLPCRMVDGGLCSNFPVHFFDAAVPRWPTFGLWLAQRLRHFPTADVWLPEKHLEGRGDNWLRFEPRTQINDAPDKPLSLGHAAGFLLSMVLTMMNWNDSTHAKLPQVRNRVVRMALRPDEGQLHIAMPADKIMDMAARYGTAAGKVLVAAYAAPVPTGAPKQQWVEHVYVRTQLLLRSLRALLRGLGDDLAARGHTLPAAELLHLVASKRALSEKAGRVGEDEAGRPLAADEAVHIESSLRSLCQLEAELCARLEGLPYAPRPEPELRLRAPL